MHDSLYKFERFTSELAESSVTTNIEHRNVWNAYSTRTVSVMMLCFFLFADYITMHSIKDCKIVGIVFTEYYLKPDGQEID